MKKVIFFAGLLIALTVSSCSKDIDTTYAPAPEAEKTTTVAKTKAASFQTSFGALIGVPDSETNDPYGFSVSVANELGISCIRDRTPVPSTKKVKLLTSGYNIVLNFNSQGHMPQSFRKDLTAYQNDLKKCLANFTVMPAVAVIENEESNSKYYKGTPTEYINQLKAAIEVMHSYNIPVANAGITSSGLKYLVYQDYLNRGMIDEANSYRSRMRIALKNAEVQDRAAFIKVLLDAYATMDLDYVNFHWRSEKSEDTQALGETIDYLQRATGKPVMTNEIGQYDTNTGTLDATVEMCRSYKMPYVLWYSAADGRSTPLHKDNKTLTTTGNAYHDFLGK